MGIAFFPVFFITVFWACLGIVGPMLVFKSENAATIRCMLCLTAFTCWLFWFCCYMSQANPLFGPKLDRNTVLIIANEWGRPVIQEPTSE